MSPSLEIHLEIFEGPLDLLLFLIKKDDLDIHNIPISHITHEYLDYIQVIKDLNLDLAGEFLVMASSLMSIKAKSLLPKNPARSEDEPDPQSDLVAKLLEYQKFKAVSEYLEGRSEEFKNVFYRGTPHFEDSEKTLSVGLFDLLSALKDILARGESSSREILGEEFPIEEKIAKISRMLEEKAAVSWEDIFFDEKKRRGILSCFLALLELIRLQKVFVRQDSNFGKILIFKKEAQSLGNTEPAASNGNDSSAANGNGSIPANGNAGHANS
jgi:segregation and condensation protein A